MSLSILMLTEHDAAQTFPSVAENITRVMRFGDGARVFYVGEDRPIYVKESVAEITGFLAQLAGMQVGR